MPRQLPELVAHLVGACAAPPQRVEELQHPGMPAHQPLHQRGVLASELAQPLQTQEQPACLTRRERPDTEMMQQILQAGQRVAAGHEESALMAGLGEALDHRRGPVVGEGRAGR